MGEESPQYPPSSAKPHQETPWGLVKGQLLLLGSIHSPSLTIQGGLLLNLAFLGKDGYGGEALLSLGPLSNQREPDFKGFPFSTELTGNVHH